MWYGQHGREEIYDLDASVAHIGDIQLGFNNIAMKVGFTQLSA
jgi:hypothetical protein